MYNCIFCHFEFDGSTHRCENGYDSETFESWYCGNAYCPACGSCQGRTDVTFAMQANAAVMRAIHEHAPFCWRERKGAYALGPVVHYPENLPEAFRREVK